MNNTDIKPYSWAAWCAAFRPKTLPISATPILAGLAIAFMETGVFKPLVALPTVLVAIMLQMITNMENDVGYAQRNAERSNRGGFPRATCNGWLSCRAVHIAIAALAILVFVVAAPLFWIGGWPIVAMAVFCLATAYCYMGGPLPIAYTPFGELFVMVTFGVCAVTGTVYLQVGHFLPVSAVYGAAFGMIAAAVLAVNNFRDREHDASVGRKTLAVVLPEKAFLALYWLMMLFPFILVGWTVTPNMARWPVLVVLLSVGRASKLASTLGRCTKEQFNGHMLGTVRMEVAFGLLLACGAVLAGSRVWM